MSVIQNSRVAILVGNGVNVEEVGSLRQELEEASISVALVAEQLGEVKAFKNNWELRLKVDHTIVEVTPEMFDALVLPAYASEKLTEHVKLVIKAFRTEKKLIACIGTGGVLLAEVCADENFTLATDPALSPAPDIIFDQGILSTGDVLNSTHFIKKLIDCVKEGSHYSIETITQNA